ncbi:probable caffeoyl-CoA O-methyltransferase 2 [Ptychodera flava]|uniref:probable caffeoyl-CoA O-methyltransferase 2 n=1 Tax=Ptychodera flava TaxID=63121 RepID=UPI003969DA2B
MVLFTSFKADSKTAMLALAGAVSVGTAIGCLIGYRMRGGGISLNIAKSSYKGERSPIMNYFVDHSLREPKVLSELKDYTINNVNNPIMLCAPEVAQFFRLLLKLLKAKKTIEIGTYTGYNALSSALALPDDGKVVACDVSKEFTDVARQYWKDAGVDHKIDLRLQPASKTLDDLSAAGEAGTFDFVFIDADKTSVMEYYEKSLALVRHGGIVAIDNVLWFGRVVDPKAMDEKTMAIRAINDKVKSDDRVEISMLFLGDGVTLAMKK